MNKLNVNRAKMIIRNISLAGECKYSTTSESLAINIKRLYFQLTGIEMTLEQASFIDKLGNTKAIQIYKALTNL